MAESVAQIDAPLVWVVIPTWNRRADLLECLETVQVMGYPRFRVLVVDNASQDSSVRAVRAHFPSVEVFPLDRNYGATGASNVGFRHALIHNADYVLRLDSDTVVDPYLLSRLVTAAQESADIGVLTAKIYFYHDPTLIWFAGASQHRWHFGAYNTGRYEHDALKNSHPCDVDYAWSTGMLISRSVLETTGGFDPDFLVYYEEVNFCLRVRQAGFRIRYAPTAKLWHKVGSEANNPWVAEQWARSKMILFRKHSHGLHRLALIGYAFAYAFLRALRPARGKGNRGPLPATLRGLVSGLRQSLSDPTELV